MTDTPLERFVRSAQFERMFREGMSLVEETAAYLDGPGREASKDLPRAAALAYAGESMRLTTRLMQLASWLMIQRAVREGEIAEGDARLDKYRLEAKPTSVRSPGFEILPAQLFDLMERTERLYQRARRCDEALTHSETPPNAVAEHLARLQSALRP